MNSDRIKSLANIVASNLSEAANRTKRNPTRDFLRKYPVSDTEIVRPIKKSEKKKEEKQSVAEAGPLYHQAKPPRKGSVAYNAMMKRKEQDRNRVKEIEAIGTKNHHIGVAKVTKEDIEDVSETYKYIDQSGGHEIKGKSGTFVGYTHSTTKGKGANILKHNKTGQYYAAGGSSTAFTQKTTLHDSPEAAAKAYHKGNLAEENLEEGSNSETEGMVSYIHHIIKNHVYPRAGDKEGYMKHVAKHMPTIVKSNPKLFRRAHSIAYDRFFHVDKNDDYDHTDHSMRQGERGMREELDSGDSELEKAIKRRNAVYQSNRQSIDIHKSGIKADNSEYAHEKNTDRLNQLRNKDFEKNQERKDREDKALLKKYNPGPLKTFKQAMENFTTEGIVDSLADAERDRQIKNNTADLDRKKKLNSVEAAKELAKVKKSEDDAKYYRGEQVEVVNNEAYMGKVKMVSNPREKWMKSVKDRGYDMRAGAQRLQDLLDKQKKERAEIEQRAKEKGLEY
jgi:hypothetical protein